MRPITPFTPSPVREQTPLAETTNKPAAESRTATLAQTPALASTPSASAFQPGAKARRNSLISQVKGSPSQSRASEAEKEDPISQAATAGVFNPHFEQLGLVPKDHIVVGFGGLTYREERALFPGISCGFSDPQSLMQRAEEFLHTAFRPSAAMGF